MAISNWEPGKATPRAKDVAGLVTLFGTVKTQFPPPPPEVSLGGWVAQKRTAKGLTRNELAAKADISPAQIANIETGKTANPRHKTRAALEPPHSLPPSDRGTTDRGPGLPVDTYVPAVEGTVAARSARLSASTESTGRKNNHREQIIDGDRPDSAGVGNGCQRLHRQLDRPVAA